MMKKKAARSKVLLVEDTLSLARAYGEYLKDEPVDIDHVETGREAFSRLEAGLPDVVLLDLVLPDIGGLEILKHIHEHQLSCEVVVITAHGSINTAVEAMRLGAFDFLVKPFNAERLRVTLSNALDRHHLAGMVKAYRDTGRKEYCGFVGSSLSMQAVYRIIDSAAQSKATVFITGESGTGKEVCAEAIHARSKRSRGPFIAINCGAIPMDLMESEIFGHVKGAFTGAIAERDGAARRADGGTLFLDEVCEMDMQLQTKLLRFVQTGNFQKVGGSKMETVDIRFVCATNREPYAEVAAGRFREDLFYRLHVIPIQLPRLGERGEDVLAIAEHFLDAYTQEEQKSFGGFSPEVQAAFLAYDWPGNIRQLQNVVRNIVVLNAGGEITLQMLPPPLGEIQDEAPGEAPVPSPSRPTPPPSVAAPAPGQTLAEIERHAIESAIAECDGNVPKAAALLGVSASTLYRKRAAWEQEEGA